MPVTLDAQFVLDVQRVMLSEPWMVRFVIVLARWMIFFEIAIGCMIIGSSVPRVRFALRDVAWSGGFALFFTMILSYLFARARPYLAVKGVALLIPPPWNFSFPSGHTAAAIAIACAFFAINRRAGIVAFVFAVFIAFGRMAAGVHYPSDLIGGMIVGIAGYVVFHFLIHPRLQNSSP